MPGSRSILVAEDVAMMRRFMELTLTRAGYDVCGAANSADALRLMATRRFDAAVIDINLPGMDGFAVAERARGMQQNGPSIIFVTTRWAPELPRLVVSAGGPSLLLKPFDPIDLLRAVELGLAKGSQTGHSAFGEPP